MLRAEFDDKIVVIGCRRRGRGRGRPHRRRRPLSGAQTRAPPDLSRPELEQSP